jgi:pimeloyl-ACP methyl ester carboxylesterase
MLPREIRDGRNTAMKKIACLFPGIGYTCDKPLLYYSWKLLRNLDWEVVPVSYTGFPDKVKGNPEKMRQCAVRALEQTNAILRDVDWKAYGEVLFVGKSIGTAVCSAYAEQHGISCRRILFTPVEETFRYAQEQAVAFHGTSDPWAETKAVEEGCKRQGIPLYETKGANHSLETGDIDADLKELRKVMRTVYAFVTRES